MKNINEKLHEKLTFQKVAFYIFSEGKDFFPGEKILF